LAIKASNAFPSNSSGDQKRTKFLAVPADVVAGLGTPGP
jgi:hypothetical protein